MAAAEFDFSVEQGATFSAAVTFKDDAGAPHNLTGYTARMQVRRSISDTGTLVELTTTNGRITITPATGRIVLLLDADLTAGFTWTRGVYDLEIESPAGEVRRLLRGRVSVSREVTR